MSRIRLDGYWYDWSENTISGARLKALAGVDASRRIIFTTEKDRSGTALDDSRNVPIDSTAVVMATTLPGSIHYGSKVDCLREKEFQNLDKRDKFILAQIFQISERYYFRNQNAMLLSKNCDFLVIRDFPIPRTGSWQMRSATICIYFPKNYPVAAPVGFFIDAKSGGSHVLHGSAVYPEPNQFFQKHGLHDKGYGFYCWHPEKNWKANLDDPFKPDNLDSLLKGYRFAMEESAIEGGKTAREVR